MSSRTLDADLLARSAQPAFGFVVLVSIDFPSGVVRAHTGVGTYSFGGNVYHGVGALGGVSAMTESVDGQPDSIKLTLSSVNEDIMSAIVGDNVYGRAVEIYVGALDEEYRLLGTPTLWVDGYVEKRELSVGKNDAVQLTVQDEAARFKQRSNRRYTLEDHQERYPGDLFFEFLPWLQNAKISWAGEQVRLGHTNTGGLTGTGGGLPRGGGGNDSKRRPGR